MGVQGLWNILHTTGRDIDLSSLRGKVLAIDLSIWLNQALKSGIDSPNVHLEILFRRICKLLFYKIKPVFVFDGPSPTLKKETILNRRKLRQLKQEKSEQIKLNIINLLMKKKLVEKRKHSDTNKSEINDLFKLPENEYYDIILRNELNSEFGFSDTALDYLSNFSSMNEVNIESESFHSMPLEVQHEVIRYIAKEKRYGYDTNQSSFSNKSGEDFSSLQIQRLLSRNTLQQKVEDLRTTMNYRNNQNAIGSLGKHKLNNLPQTINAKRILSRNEGYLMMIDPSETDMVDTLTKLKAEYLFKKSDQNSAQSDEEILVKDNDEKFIDSSIISSINSCDNKNNDLFCNFELIPENENFEKIHSNSDQSDLSMNNPPNEIDNINKLHVKSIQMNETFSLVNVCIKNDSIINPTLEMISSHGIYGTKGSKEQNENELYDDKFDENVLTKNCINESEPEVIKTNTIDEDIQINRPTSDYYNRDEFNGNNSNKIDLINFVDNVERNETSLNSIDNDNHDDEEEDDDFVDVPEINVDAIESEEKSKYFSETDIEMILNDPMQWQENIEESIDALYKEDHKIECQAASMSERYYQEAKDLLKLFGIPFIESPGEAEAQCAFLERSNLTDGTITEDSDIWLFGGSMVYKHVFSRDFSVRAYSIKQISKVLGLSQDLMICVALLSGSDYTAGIYGIGPVIAMEILAEFSDPDIDQSHFQVLENFKLWHNNWSKIPEKYKGNPDRKRFLRFQLDHNFPDQRIVDAYNEPLVDESKEPFIWSKPSIDKLLDFAQTKIGWEKLKVIEMLDVIGKGNHSEKEFVQKSILDYFNDSKVDELLNSKKSPSKRLKLATKHRNLIVDNIKNKFKK